MYTHTNRIYTYVLYIHVHTPIHYKFGSLDVDLPTGINQNLRSTSSFHIA